MSVLFLNKDNTQTIRNRNKLNSYKKHKNISQESLFDKIDQLYKMCNSINEKLDEIKKSIGIKK